MKLRLPRAFALLTIAACVDDRFEVADATKAVVPCEGRVMGLRIDPPQSEIDAGLLHGAEVRFRALATFEGGVLATVPVAWALSRADVGSIDADGVFTASGEVGADVEIVGSVGEHTSVARIHVKHVERVVQVDSSVAAFFADGVERDDRSAPPRILAPAADTELREDSAPVRFQWDADGHRWSRLLLSTTAWELTVVTGAAEYSPDPELWQRLTRTAGGRHVTAWLETADGEDVVHRARAPVAYRACAAQDLCDGLDDDCDGSVDGACSEAGQPFTTTGEGICE